MTMHESLNGLHIEFCIDGNGHDHYRFTGVIIATTAEGYMVRLDPQYTLATHAYDGTLIHDYAGKKSSLSEKIPRKIMHVGFGHVYDIAERGVMLGKKLGIVE